MVALAAPCPALPVAMAEVVQALLGLMHRWALPVLVALALQHHWTTLRRHARVAVVVMARRLAVLAVPGGVAPVALVLPLEQQAR